MTSVRVGELSIGNNPIRLLSLKTLPHDFQIARDHTLMPQEGEFINVEATFLYHRPPPPAKHRKKNIKLMLHMAFGVKRLGKLGSVEVPIHLKVVGLIGRIRLRLHIEPDPPWISATQISFPEMPELQVQARPMRTLDVMNLPFIADYILKSVRTVLKAFTSPESYMIDISKVLLGSDVRLSACDDWNEV